MNDAIKKLKGKNIFVILKSGRVYSGKVNSIDEGMIDMTDKFNQEILFNSSEISSAEIKKTF